MLHWVQVRDVHSTGPFLLELVVVHKQKTSVWCMLAHGVRAKVVCFVSHIHVPQATDCNLHAHEPQYQPKATKCFVIAVV